MTETFEQTCSRRAMLTRLSGYAAASAIAAALASPAHAQSFTDLHESGPVLGNRSNAYGISADGSTVVGYGRNAGGQSRASIWSAATGSRTEINTLGSAYANAANADGTVVVGGANDPSNNTIAFRWTQASGVVTISNTFGGDGSSANGVSADGSVIVGSATNGDEDDRAFRWTAIGGMVDLGTLGGNDAEADGVSADGSVVVGSSENGDGNDRAFRWTQAGGMVGIGKLGDDSSYSYAEAVSGNGLVIVGYANDVDDHNRAFRWTQGGGMVSLGVLAGANAASYSEAYAVNADGSVIVGQANDASNNDHAFRWTAATGIQTVEDWLRGQGLTIIQDVTVEANGVSADGNVIVGQLFDPVTEQRHAFIARGGSGIMDVESYNQSVATSPQFEAQAQEADLVINGANSSPMFHLLKAGQWSAWTSADIGQVDPGRGADSGGVAVGEAGLSYAPNDVFIGRVSVGATYSQQDLYLNGSNRQSGGYVVPEAIVNLGGNFYGTLTGYAKFGEMKQRRGYSNGAGTDYSTGETDTRTLGFRGRFDWLNAFSAGATAFSPYASFTHTSTKIDGFTEKTGPFPATFDGGTQRSNVARLGTDAVLPLNEGISLIARAEYAHRFESRAKGISGAIVGLNDFSFNGASVRQDWVRGGVGFKTKMGVGEALVMGNASSQTKGGAYWVNASYRIVY